MLLQLDDPGPCIVCDAPHTTCTAPTTTPGRVIAPMFTTRGPLIIPIRPPGPIASTPVQEAVQATLPPGSFTTGTYRRGRKPR